MSDIAIRLRRIEETLAAADRFDVTNIPEVGARRIVRAASVNDCANRAVRAIRKAGGARRKAHANRCAVSAPSKIGKVIDCNTVRVALRC